MTRKIISWVSLIALLLISPSAMIMGESTKSENGLTITSQELVLTNMETLNLTLDFSEFTDSGDVDSISITIQSDGPQSSIILLESEIESANISNLTANFNEQVQSFWDGSQHFSATMNLLNSNDEVLASIVEYFVVFEQSGLLNPSKFVVFGDSLSDQGNVEAYTNLINSPPYWQGRITNGPVWAEWTGAGFGIEMERGTGGSLNGTNRAWGGAAAGEGLYQGVVMNAGPQIEDYLTHNEVNDEDLFAIWIGGNNFLRGASDTQQVVDLIIGHVETLSNAGATRIVVMNLPNMEMTPYYSEYSEQEIAEAKEDSATYNSQLLHDVIALNARTNAVIQLVEINKMFDNVAENIEYYHITEIAEPVCEFEGEMCIGSPDSVPPSDGHLFFDSVHPTELTHRILGKAIHEAISTADFDGDTVSIEDDLCPNTPYNGTVDENGCAESELDDDGDGVFNDVDQCDNTANDAADIDENGCQTIIELADGEFQCDNGDIINQDLTNNGEQDCIDGSDEAASDSQTKAGLPAIGIAGILIAISGAIMATDHRRKD